MVSKVGHERVKDSCEPSTDRTTPHVIILSMMYFFFVRLNPLNPKSDQHQISPCNSNVL